MLSSKNITLRLAVIALVALACATRDSTADTKTPSSSGQKSGGQTTEAWEYSPYRVKVWVATSATLELTDQLKQDVLREIVWRSDVIEGSAWRVEAALAPRRLNNEIVSSLGDMTFDRISNGDLVLVARKDEGIPEIKTLEDISQQGLRVGVCDRSDLGSETSFLLQQTKAGEGNLWDAVQPNLKLKAASGHELLEQVLGGQLDAAIVYQANLERMSRLKDYFAPTVFSQFLNTLITIELRKANDSREVLSQDKLILVSINEVGNEFQMAARELDCRTRVWGELWRRTISQTDRVPGTAFDLVASAFQPIMRIEDVEDIKEVAREARTALADIENVLLEVEGAKEASVILINIKGLLSDIDDLSGIEQLDAVNPLVQDLKQLITKVEDLQELQPSLQQIKDSLDSIKNFKYVALGKLRAGGLLYGRSYIGIEGRLWSPITPTPTVLSVHAGSPAQQAGVRKDDVILALDGEEIKRFNALALSLRRRQPGTTAVLTVQRGEQVLDLSMELAGKSPAWLGSGAVLQPITRRNDRLGMARPDGITVVPWTMIKVFNQDGVNFKCSVHTSFGNPLAGRNSRRFDRLALPVKPRSDTTTLRLVAQTNADKPLKGYEIWARDEDSEESDFIGRTDWRGMISIPRKPHLLRTLYVRNGFHLLARLPMVPGYRDEEVAGVPDDGYRLKVEGVISGLQTQYLNLVTYRGVLEMRIKSYIESGKLEIAEELFVEFESQLTRPQFLALLEKTKGQLRPKDSRTERKINELFAELRKEVQEKLDPKLGDELQKKLKAARAG